MCSPLQINMQIVTSIWGWSILAVILGCMPYAIWVTRTAIKKHWKKLGIQVAAPVVYFAVLAGITAFANSGASDRYFRDIYDAEGKYPEPIFKYTPERSFNGDGASLYVFELPDQVRLRFEKQDSRLLTEFPRRPHYRSDWKVVSWKEGPFDTSLEKYLEFALFATSEHTKEIQEALSRKGTFYSFFHYDHGTSPGNIDFFIVDLIGGRVYEINVNT
jgi:hypothetical protein